MPHTHSRTYSTYAFGTATEDDLADIARLYRLPLDLLRQRLQAGDWAYIARRLSDRELASALWIHRGDCFVKGLGLNLGIDDGAAYLYGGLTAPEDRMKGLFECSLHDVCVLLKSAGTTGFYALIEERNAEAYRGHLRLGFLPIVRATYFRIAFLRVRINRLFDTHRLRWSVSLTRPCNLYQI